MYVCVYAHLSLCRCAFAHVHVFMCMFIYIYIYIYIVRRALVVAFHAQNWKVPLNVLHLCPSEGGIGLWLPEVYLWTTHAATFTRYLQQPSR